MADGRPFLVCHNYGQGGLWWWISASSASEITQAYKDIIVFEQPPTWWNDDADRNARRMLITDKPDATLALLARQ